MYQLQRILKENVPELDEEYNWNEIYNYQKIYRKCTDLEEEYEKQQDYNKKIYQEIDTWEDLKSCIDWAIEKGNHAAFVKFYLHKAYNQYHIFEFVANKFFEKYSIQKKKYATWKIVKSVNWTKKDIPDIFQNEYICSEKTLYSWVNGGESRMPDKYEIVQIGLYMGLSYKETNELLEAAGKELLYIINGVDAICMFYLEQYHDPEQKETKGIEKILKVKKEIDAWLDENNLYLEKPFTAEFEEKVKDVKRKVSFPDEDLYVEDMAFYLTECYKKRFGDCKKEKDFNNFVKNFDFGIIRYGYTAKTQDFINYKRFQKNLYVSDIELKPDIKVSRLIKFLENTQKQYLYKNLKTCCKGISGNETPEKKDIIRMLNAIWKISYLRSDIENMDLFFEGNGFSKVKELIFGRNIVKADKEKNRELAQEQDAAYQFSVKNKENLIHFCVACGMEDYIGSYMRIGNYWTQDYIKTGFTDCVERRNAFIVYAIKYRDALIEKWSDDIEREYPDKEKTQFKNQMKEEFPFLQLMLEINREIQLIASQVERVRISELKGIKNDLIYPVEYDNRTLMTDKMWYLKYKERLKNEKNKTQ